jgi:membrane-associated phospholipid phosphatase
MPNSTPKSRRTAARELRRRGPRDGWSLPLSPRFALVAGVAAASVVVLVAALVWHTRRPNAADAEMMRWQEVARVWGDGIATTIVHAVGPLVVLAMLASAALAWRVKRWDAVVLALVAAPGTLVIELLLKQVVHRQRPGGPDLLYPSGHVAAATAAAVTAVLVLRATLASPRARVRVAWLAGLLVVVIAAARLVQTVHFVTDVVGGVALGLAVTCWAALAITAGAGSACPRRLDRVLPGRRSASRPGTTNAPPRDPSGTS